MLRVLIKSNAVIRNNKSGGKFGRFSGEYPKYGRFYKIIWKPQLYHKSMRPTANIGELECMAWNVMRKFFTLIFQTVQKTFAILCNAFTIFRNPLHRRYNELIIFVIVYFLLHCPPHSVFLSVYNVNFEEMLLYSMM